MPNPIRRQGRTRGLPLPLGLAQLSRIKLGVAGGSRKPIFTSCTVNTMLKYILFPLSGRLGGAVALLRGLTRPSAVAVLESV